jgi:endonuclease YncB( thermonuclease family)
MVWEFKGCKLHRVVDGDTVDIWFDLGFRVFSSQRIRIWGIDAPEPRGKSKRAGKIATGWLEKYFERNPEFSVDVEKTHGKYRWVGRIKSKEGDVGALMVTNGLAIYKEYK